MTISETDKNGYFIGSYLTAVTTHTDVEIKKSPISGVIRPSSQPIFAFHVKWTFSGKAKLLSIAQYIRNSEHNEHLYNSAKLQLGTSQNHKADI